MGNAFRNHEGYPDPTAGQALQRLSKEEMKGRPIVYVCSPYSGEIEKNVESTKACSRFVISRGAFPLNPILNLHGVLEESTDREKAIRIDLRLLERADELWLFGEPTAGMKRELAAAEKLRLPVRRFVQRGGTDSEWMEI